MKTFEEFHFDVIDAQVFRKKFLELSHLNELDKFEIRFDVFEYKNMMFYFYKQICFFYITRKQININYMYINYQEIWSHFVKMYDNQYVIDNITNIINDYFPSDYNIEVDWRSHLDDLTKEFYRI
ncbi:hypothetical protein M0Q50_02260 [bacterium]|jgi:hypothetical protein|nr:hypothetical protein [bacterium]